MFLYGIVDQLSAISQNTTIMEGERHSTNMSEIFAKFAVTLSYQCGRAHTFLLAIVLILIVCAIGFHSGFTTDLLAWVGAITGIISILLLLLLQADQQRGNLAVQLKLDELLRALPAARNQMIAAELRTHEELQDEQELIRKMINNPS